MDIVEDEQIVEWGESKPSKKYVSKELSGTLKEKAKKVIEWLKSAETESESEEVRLIKTVFVYMVKSVRIWYGLYLTVWYLRNDMYFMNIFRIPMRMKLLSMILPR